MRSNRRLILALSTLAMAASAASHAQMTSTTPAAERRSTLGDQQSVAITIYNEDLALVKDARKVTLEEGANRLALRERAHAS
jgi:hypothetical protein